MTTRRNMTDAEREAETAARMARAAAIPPTWCSGCGAFCCLERGWLCLCRARARDAKTPEAEREALQRARQWATIRECPKASEHRLPEACPVCPKRKPVYTGLLPSVRP